MIVELDIEVEGPEFAAASRITEDDVANPRARDLCAAPEIVRGSGLVADLNNAVGYPYGRGW